MNGKSILITGGTGTLGHALVEHILENYQPRRLIVFSRDEQKQYEMRALFPQPEVQFFLGDVRDLWRLIQVCYLADYVIHAAALKHVPRGEDDPSEFQKTNVEGSRNIILAARFVGVERVIGISTDKAVNPANAYGNTKAAMESEFIAANRIPGPRFAVARYGNVFGSRGSVAPFFQKCAQNGVILLTDPKMTRFFIRIQDAAKFVVDRLREVWGGEIFVPKMAAMKIQTLAEVIGGKDCKIEVIGIRPGEKLHETLISTDETGVIRSCNSYFTITPKGEDWFNEFLEVVPSGFHYYSGAAVLFTTEEIEEMIRGL